MTVNEKGLEAAQVAAREGCGLFIESQHVFCDDPVVGEAADGYGKPLRQPYCSCKGDAERIIKAYLRASSNDAEPVAWQYRYWYSSGEPGVWLSERRKDADDLLESGVLIREETRALFTFQPDALVHVDGVTMTPTAAANRIAELSAAQADHSTAIEPVAASPGVGEAKLTAYETQVLIGTSISGCNMSPDRVFDLKAAWTRLHYLGLIDRTDGLAIVTPAGEERIKALLAAAPTSPAPSPAGGDVVAAFDDWWSADGQYLDPDTSDVPWFDKRRGLAEAAFAAGRGDAK